MCLILAEEKNCLQNFSGFSVFAERSGLPGVRAQQVLQHFQPHAGHRPLEGPQVLLWEPAATAAIPETDGKSEDTGQGLCLQTNHSALADASQYRHHLLPRLVCYFHLL